MHSRLVSIAVLAVFALLLPSSSAGAARSKSPAKPEARNFAIVNGQEVAIRNGSVVARGELTEQGCLFGAPFRVGGGTTDTGLAPPSVHLDINDRCEVIATLTAASDEGTVPAGAEQALMVGKSASLLHAQNRLKDRRPRDNVRHPQSHHRHKGWAWIEVKENYGIVATRTWAEMKYLQNWNKVWGGFDPYGYCYHSSYPWWQTLRCDQYWSPNGPNTVWTDVVGAYRNNAGTIIQYDTRARYVGTTNDWYWYCQLIPYSTFPPTWSTDCGGGRSQI